MTRDQLRTVEILLKDHYSDVLPQQFTDNQEVMAAVGDCQVKLIELWERFTSQGDGVTPNAPPLQADGPSAVGEPGGSFVTTEPPQVGSGGESPAAKLMDGEEEAPEGSSLHRDPGGTEAAAVPEAEKVADLVVRGEDVPSPEGGDVLRIPKRIQLVNGMVGREYRVDLPHVLGEDLEIFDVRVDEAEALGLQLLDGPWRLEGSPQAAGEHTLRLRYRTPPRQDRTRQFETNLQVTINPDPRSLWRNLPSDRNDKYWKEDTESQLVASGERLLIAASCRGRSHAHEGRFRDDAFRLDLLPKDWFVAAVADGAGTASFSRKGSSLATLQAVDCLRKSIPEELGDGFSQHLQRLSLQATDAELRQAVNGVLYKVLGNAALEAYKAIEQEAREVGAPPRNFATTLLMMIAKEYDFGWFLASYGVGDGVIGVLRHSRDVHLLTEPDSGEYAGQTRFVTTPEIWGEGSEVARRIRFELLSDITGAILMTDGVTDPKFHTENDLRNLKEWERLWSDLTSSVDLGNQNDKAADQLLAWLEFWSAGNHDDRTIAILC